MGQIALGVEDDAAYRAVLPGLGLELLDPFHCPGSGEVGVVLHRLKALFLGETVRAGAAEHHMGGGGLYGVCGVNGMLYMAHSSYRSGTEVPAFHDCGVQLEIAFGGDGRSDSGIEQRIALEVTDD